MKLAAHRCVWTVAMVFLSSGCFRYVPVELGTLPEGRQVRVQMTRQGFAALPEIPNQSGPRLTGTLVARVDDQLKLRVPFAVDGLNRTLGQDILIPASQIVGSETRKLSRTRTAVAITGGLASAVALFLTFEKGHPFNREETKPPEEEGFTKPLRRILLFRIPIP